MGDWWEDIEPKVFTLVKTRMQKGYKKPDGTYKYPNILYTTQIQTITDTQFPCIYLHLVDSYEIGTDISRLYVNALNVTFQVEVYVNTSQDECGEIMGEVVKQFKKLRFSIYRFPSYTNTGGVIRGVIRAKRVIGANDIIGG